MHSVILPVYNEAQNEFFGQILANLAGLRDWLEICVVDGGSTDGTAAKVQEQGFRVLSLPGSCRAERLNAGIEAVRGELILFHHPRSIIAPEGLKHFADLKATAWGGFTHTFNDRHPLLRFTSWYSNHVRFRRGVVYLDHCIYAPRTWLLAIAKVPTLEIFEDTVLSYKLRALSPPRRLSFSATTSAIRFRKNGIYRQALINQWLKIRFLLGFSPHASNRLYEKSLNLNNQVGTMRSSPQELIRTKHETRVT